MSFDIEFPDASTIAAVFGSLREVSDSVRFFVGPDRVEIAELVAGNQLFFHVSFERSQAVLYDFKPRPGDAMGDEGKEPAPIVVAFRPDHLNIVLKTAMTQDHVRFVYDSAASTKGFGVLSIIRTSPARTDVISNAEIHLEEVNDTRQTLAPVNEVDYTLAFRSEAFLHCVERLSLLEGEFSGWPCMTITITPQYFSFGLGTHGPQTGSLVTKGVIKMVTDQKIDVETINSAPATKKRRRGTGSTEVDPATKRLPKTKTDSGIIIQHFKISHLKHVCRFFGANHKNSTIIVLATRDAPMVFRSTIGAVLANMQITLMFETDDTGLPV